MVVAEYLKELMNKCLSLLNKIKSLPKETKIYCGHEYTLSNSKFCIKNDPDNQNLQKKIEQIKKLTSNGLPTIPTTIKDELDCNIFLRAKNLNLSQNCEI